MPGTSTEQVVDKGIRQKSTKEWTHSLTAVPFVRGHRSVFPWTPRNTGVYTRHPTSQHEWRVDTASGKTLKKRNACSDVRQSAVQNKIAGLNGLRSEGVLRIKLSLNNLRKFVISLHYTLLKVSVYYVSLSEKIMKMHSFVSWLVFEEQQLLLDIISLFNKIW